MDALATSLDDGSLPRSLLVEIARRAIESTRDTETDAMAAARLEAGRLGRLRPQRVINATGVLLHTNLGRAPIAPEAAEAGRRSGAHASPVEFDLAAGRRGGRGAYAHALLESLTGAEAALVVNNTAGALLLALAALADSGSAIVSRGELIEIGGSFRLPDLMGASGARLVEVGTTNRTRLGDYRKAIDGSARVILKVHPSNYRIEGFTDAVSYRDLAGLAAERGLEFIADIGSGLLDGRVPWIEGPPPEWLAEEPAVRQTVADGVGVILFSGDKLLGGPQAGIAVGRSAAIGAMRSHPIARAVRIGGPALDSLATTLEMYAGGRGNEIPFWRMAGLSFEALAMRSEALIAGAAIEATVFEDRSLPGAGTVPGKGIPGPMILIPGDVEAMWRRLLDRPIPIVTRRDERGLIVDPRAVDPDDDGLLAESLAAACR